MRMTDKNKTTKFSKVDLQNMTSISPSNVILTLTLLGKKGGEMYGM